MKLLFPVPWWLEQGWDGSLSCTSCPSERGNSIPAELGPSIIPAGSFHLPGIQSSSQEGLQPLAPFIDKHPHFLLIQCSSDTFYCFYCLHVLLFRCLVFSNFICKFYLLQRSGFQGTSCNPCWDCRDQNHPLCVLLV